MVLSGEERDHSRRRPCEQRRTWFKEVRIRAVIR